MTKDDEAEVLDPAIEKVESGQPVYVSGKTAYHCKICDCWINSYASVTDHLSGGRHKQSLLNKQKNAGSVAVPLIAPKKPDKHSDAPVDPETRSYGMYLIKKLPSETPVIGLEYVVETQPSISNELTFDCELCSVQTNIGTFIPHLTGFKHKSAFMKKHAEKDYAEAMSYPKKADQTTELNRRILEYQKIHGQGVIVVKNLTIDSDAKPGEKRSSVDTEAPAAKKPALNPPVSVAPLSTPQEQEKPQQSEQTLGTLTVKTWEDIEAWSRDCEIKSDAEAAAALRMANLVTTSLIKYKVKQMPVVIQEEVEKALAEGDDARLEDIIEGYKKGTFKVDNAEPPKCPVAPVPASAPGDMKGPNEPKGSVTQVPPHVAPMDTRGPNEMRGLGDMRGPNEPRGLNDMRGPNEPFGRDMRDMPPRNMPGGRMQGGGGGMDWDRGPGDFWRGPGPDDGFRNDHFSRDDHINRNPMFERQRPLGGPDMSLGRMGRNMFNNPRGFRDEGNMPRGYQSGHDMYNRR